MANETPPPVALQGWTPKAVREGKVTDNPKGAGKLQAFYVDFEGADGFKANGTYWRRKEGNAPELDKPVTGTISVGDYGYRFKMESGQGGTSSSGGQDYGRRNGGGKSPDQQASIVRQHSQESALRFAAATGSLADLDLADEGLVQNILDGQLKPIIDWFVEDANKAADGAGQHSSSPEPRSAPPQASTEQGYHERLQGLLEGAGVNWAIAQLLKDFALTELSAEKQDEIISALQDSGRKDKCVKWLEGEYTTLKGALPAPKDPGDDIPFSRPAYPELFSERECRSNRSYGEVRV